MFRRHLQSAATVTAIAAVALSATTGLASARTAKHGPAHKPRVVTTRTAVAMEAFPTGGKGSATEEVCHDWTIWLNEDEEQLENATTTVEMLDASDQKKADVDAALDAGCAVID